jgi:hypothetical protein
MAVTNTPEMKACPFCGCETVRQFHPFEQRGYIIDCNRCNGGFHNIPKDQAVERWNTRAPSRPADQVPDKVFNDCEDGNEPTEYVRADLSRPPADQVPDMVERVARALCYEDGPQGCGCNGECKSDPFPPDDIFMRYARAAIAAIPPAGGVEESEVARLKVKLLSVATERDRLEKLFEEITELRATLNGSAGK